MQEAVENGDINKVYELIKKGVNVNVSDEYGNTPLKSAIKDNDVEMVKLLITNGADVNFRDKYEQTPLHFASFNGLTDIVKILLDYGADVNARDHYDSTSLHKAPVGGHTQIVKLLLDHGAIVDARDKDNQTPLQIAVYTSFEDTRGHEDIVKLLLDYGANPVTQNKYGKTPLIFAMVRKGIDIVRILLQYPEVVDGINHRENKGFTALGLAIRRRLEDIVKLLLSHGADPSMVSMEADDITKRGTRSGMSYDSDDIVVNNYSDSDSESESESAPTRKMKSGYNRRDMDSESESESGFNNLNIDSMDIGPVSRVNVTSSFSPKRKVVSDATKKELKRKMLISSIVMNPNYKISNSDMDTFTYSELEEIVRIAKSGSRIRG